MIRTAARLCLVLAVCISLGCLFGRVLGNHLLPTPERHAPEAMLACPPSAPAATGSYDNMTKKWTAGTTITCSGPNGVLCAANYEVWVTDATNTTLGTTGCINGQAGCGGSFNATASVDCSSLASGHYFGWYVAWTGTCARPGITQVASIAGQDFTIP